MFSVVDNLTNPQS